uniref:Uncharacterized protein n=1 Tax=Tanacetum cinerariifolium TaxID=118510 RepID=A0A699KCF8_TANCI|nr:hypothetical protein [Tanacetum cinerariifolium]
MTKFLAIETLYLNLLHYLTAYEVSTFLFLEFKEVLRLLLVGSLSSSKADSDGGDVVKIVSTAVCSGTAREFFVAVTAGIVTVVGWYGPSKMHFLKDRHLVLYQCILRNVISIECIFPLQAMVDDPLNQLP